LITVQIFEEMYLAGLENCNNHLHGRILLNKGDKNLMYMYLRKKLGVFFKVMKSDFFE